MRNYEYICTVHDSLESWPSNSPVIQSLNSSLRYSERARTTDPESWPGAIQSKCVCVCYGVIEWRRMVRIYKESKMEWVKN